MEKINEIKLSRNLKEIDNNIIICLTTTDKNFIPVSKEDKFDVERI
jgi:hypothetical protein